MVETQYRFDEGSEIREGSPKLQPLTSQGQNSSLVFWCGSFNSCLIGQKPFITDWLERQLFESNLLKLDQLYVSMKDGKIMKTFVEFPIKFPPTSAFEKDMKSYTRNEIPAYSDRIFVMGRDVEFDEYYFISGYTNSHHKPVILAVKIALSDREDFSHLQSEMIVHDTSKRKSWKRHSSMVMMVSQLLPNTWELTDFEWNASDPIEDRMFKAIHTPSKKEYFVHTIPKTSKVFESDQFMELHLLSYIESPFVQKCHRIFSDLDTIYCILEPFHSDIASLLGKQIYGEEEAKFYVSQVILGLKDMHAQNIVHGNINPNSIKLLENGFVTLSGYKTGGPTNGDYIDPYTSPSSVNQKAVDFYAIGILTFQLQAGITDKSFDLSQTPISTKGKDFISKLLNKDPNARLGSKSGIEELMKHPWLAGYNWKGMIAFEIAPPFVPVHMQRKKSGVGETIRSFKNRRSLDSSLLSKGTFSGIPNEIQTSPKLVSSRRTSSQVPMCSTDDVGTSRRSTESGEDELLRKLSLGSDINPNTGSLGFNLSPRGSMDSSLSETDFHLGDEIKRESTRLEIIAEILSTEEIYFKSLKIVIHHFYNPLLNILSKEIHQAIFQSLSSIVVLNGTFLTQLESTIDTHSEFDAIMDVLYRSAVEFRAYADYTSNYVTAFETMEKERKKNTKFAKFLVKAREELTKTNQMGDLLSYLVLPVQRLPRYKGLFEELLKVTPKQEQVAMQRAVDEITLAVGLCNEKTRDNDVRRQILALQQKYNLPIKPQTILIQKGQSETVKIIYNGKKPVINPEYLIVFNDLIIFQYKDKFRLTKYVKFPIDNYTMVKVASQNPVKAVGIVEGKESLVFLFEYDYTWQKWSKVFPIPTDTSNSIFI